MLGHLLILLALGGELALEGIAGLLALLEHGLELLQGEVETLALVLNRGLLLTRDGEGVLQARLLQRERVDEGM